MRLATLHIDKQAHKFSAAHFTIFSATERERLHGHNYSMSARIVAPMGPEGFSADYNVYKRRMKALCDVHDEYMLLAKDSPHHRIDEIDGEYHVLFNGKTLRFPVDETLLLPVINVTVEELSHYLLAELLKDGGDEGLLEVEMFISSGDGQTASARWSAAEKKGM